MILHDFYMQPRDINLSERMDFQTRCVCHYLSRYIRSPKYITDFTRISIKLWNDKIFKSGINCSNILEVRQYYDYLEYKSLKNENELHEYFIGLFKYALDNLKDKYNIPYGKLIEGLDSFRDSGYSNEWKIKNKIFRDKELKCCFQGKLTLYSFTCTLKILRKTEVLYSNVIYDTKPDEFFFNPNLREIKNRLSINGNILIIPNAFGKKDIKIDLSSMLS